MQPMQHASEVAGGSICEAKLTGLVDHISCACSIQFLMSLKPAPFDVYMVIIFAAQQCDIIFFSFSWFEGFDWNGLIKRTLVPPIIPNVR